MSQDDDVERYVVVPREPTSEMIVAGVAERHGQPVPEAWSLATANIYRAMIEAGQIRAALSAMPQRLSPDLIAQLNKLATYLTEQGEYAAVDLIDTVVARLTQLASDKGEHQP